MRSRILWVLVLLSVACVTYSQTAFTVSSLDDPGTGTRSEAIAAAQDGDTILFADELAGGTIVLTGGELDLREAITIDASAFSGGLTISENGISRIVDVSMGGAVTFDSRHRIDSSVADGTSGTSGNSIGSGRRTDG